MKIIGWYTKRHGKQVRESEWLSTSWSRELSEPARVCLTIKATDNRKIRLEATYSEAQTLIARWSEYMKSHPVD